MKKHKDMKLKDLLEFTDYHEMLNQSETLAFFLFIASLAKPF